MTEEILVNVSVGETRLAVVEQGVLQHLHIERSSHRSLLGNIYLGKVVRVMPGMQAAFIDIGEEKSGFLHVDDLRSYQSTVNKPSDNISDILRQGQSLLVQVSRDPLAEKGAGLTSQLSLASRYLVYRPGSSHIGLSQQIASVEERSRLREVLQRAMQASDIGDTGGFIIRTAAEDAGLDALMADINYLTRFWQLVSKRAEAAASPLRVYQDWQLGQRSIRDLVGPETERILIDDQMTYQALSRFCEDFAPKIKGLIELYSDEKPLFDIYGVEDEINRGLGRRIELKSGGHLVIDQTEAMTTIDVNTGSFLGRNRQEETIFQTNLEAAVSLARQLRLRNLGGIIIIDFIDMQDVEHRRQLVHTLEQALSRDPTTTVVTGVSDLGLVAMTRKRVRKSLGHYLCDPCPHCDGRGELKSAETVCYDIFRELMRHHRKVSGDNLLVKATQEVVDRLRDEEAGAVADLGEFLGKTVQFRVEPVYSREQFDIIRL